MKALRDAKQEKELDACVGLLALHLGLIDDAKQLFIGCERYDLLCELHQARGEWEEAIAVAERHDRSHPISHGRIDLCCGVDHGSG